MDDTATNACGVRAPTIIERIEGVLFPQSYPERWPDPDEYPTPFGWAPGALHTDTYAELGMLDRLRVLVSGKLAIRCTTRTDVIVKKAESRSTFSALPPWHQRRS